MQTWVIVLLWVVFFVLGGIAAWSNWKRGHAVKDVNHLIYDIENRDLDQDLVLKRLKGIRKDLGY